jgi:hypothetical protein
VVRRELLQREMEIETTTGEPEIIRAVAWVMRSALPLV